MTASWLNQHRDMMNQGNNSLISELPQVFAKPAKQTAANAPHLIQTNLPFQNLNQSLGDTYPKQPFAVQMQAPRQGFEPTI